MSFLNGLEGSPRRDLAGFVRIHDPRTLMMRGRRGKNRADLLRNIIAIHASSGCS